MVLSSMYSLFQGKEPNNRQAPGVRWDHREERLKGQIGAAISPVTIQTLGPCHAWHKELQTKEGTPEA